MDSFTEPDDHLTNSDDTPLEDPATIPTKSEYGFFNPFPEGFPLEEEDSDLLPDTHPGSCLYQDSSHEDGDGWTKVSNPANLTQTTRGKEEDLLRLLVSFHSGNDTQSKSAEVKENHRTDPDNDPLLEQARRLKLKEQEAGAERSRRLREKALRRRGLLEMPEKDESPVQETRAPKPVVLNAPAQTNIAKDDDIEMQDLLDTAQEYTTKKSISAEPQMLDKPKYVMTTRRSRHLAYN